VEGTGEISSTDMRFFSTVGDAHEVASGSTTGGSGTGAGSSDAGGSGIGADGFDAELASAVDLPAASGSALPVSVEAADSATFTTASGSALPVSIEAKKARKHQQASNYYNIYTRGSLTSLLGYVP